MGFYTNQEEKKKVSFPIKKKTLDRLFMFTGGLAALDFIVVPVASHFLTGELKTLHEYMGMPPQMNETGLGIGMIYGGLAAVYSIFMRKRFLGKKD